MRRIAAALLCCSCMTQRPMLVAPRGDTVARATLFESVRIFDGSDALTPESDVLIENGRIAAIAPHGTIAAPAGAEHIDGRGKTLLPGLIDCHVHLGGGDGDPPWAAKRPNLDAQSAALVYSGVTTILAAALDSDVADLKDRIDGDNRQAGVLRDILRRRLNRGEEVGEVAEVGADVRQTLRSWHP